MNAHRSHNDSNCPATRASQFQNSGGHAALLDVKSCIGRNPSSRAESLSYGFYDSVLLRIGHV